MIPTVPRFQALDSWRGIAACAVALGHFAALGAIGELTFFRHTWLFVDFFFVLSGFVIAANYGDRIAGGFGVWRFMLLRFGRLYPLHIAMLGILVARKAVQAAVPSLDSMAQAAAFTEPSQQPSVIAAHALLVHGFDWSRFAGWNGPSWSISVEFFVYLVFALAAATLPRRAVVVGAMVVLVACQAIIWPGPMESDSFMALRGFMGFSAGVLVWNIFRNITARPSTLLECLVMIAAFAFVWMAGGPSAAILAPIVFSTVVFVFAFETGAVSRVLRLRPFLVLGLLSYSIYLVHWPVRQALLDVARFTGVDLTGPGAMLAYLLLVVSASCVTYAYIEKPWRERFRRLASAPASENGEDGNHEQHRDQRPLTKSQDDKAEHVAAQYRSGS